MAIFGAQLIFFLEKMLVIPENGLGAKKELQHMVPENANFHFNTMEENTIVVLMTIILNHGAFLKTKKEPGVNVDEFDKIKKS